MFFWKTYPTKILEQLRPSSNDFQKHTFHFQGYVFGGMFLKSGFDSAPTICIFSNTYPRKHTLPVRKISMFFWKTYPTKILKRVGYVFWKTYFETWLSAAQKHVTMSSLVPQQATHAALIAAMESELQHGSFSSARSDSQSQSFVKEEFESSRTLQAFSSLLTATTAFSRRAPAKLRQKMQPQQQQQPPLKLSWKTPYVAPTSGRRITCFLSRPAGKLFSLGTAEQTTVLFTEGCKRFEGPIEKKNRGMFSGVCIWKKK